MAENIYTESVESRLYSSESILLATFFGGPLAGGYMTAENFKFMGEHEKAKHTWLLTILMVSVLIGFLQFTQGTKTPWYMVPLIYTLLTYVPMKILQGKQITSHLQMGTEMHKGDRVFVISFVAGVATIVGLLFTSVMVQAVMSSSISS